MNRLLIAITLIFLSLSAHALYLVDTPEHPIKPDELVGLNKDYPAVARIEGINSWATGALISPNVVLTARHVVQENMQKGSPVNKPSEYSVEINQKNYAVDKIILPEETTLDLALMILDNPVENVKPLQLRGVTEDERIEAVDILGYGMGRVIYPDDPKKIDPRFEITNRKTLMNQGDKFHFRRDFKGPFFAEKNKDILFAYINSKYGLALSKWADEFQEATRTYQETAEALVESQTPDRQAKYAEAEKKFRSLKDSKPDKEELIRHINVPLSFIINSSAVFTTKGDSGAPLLDEEGDIIGVLSQGPHELGKISSDFGTQRYMLFSDPQRRNAALFSAGLVSALHAIPLAILAGYSLDLGWAASAALGGITSIALNIAATETGSAKAPFNKLAKSFYGDPYTKIIDKNDTEILDLVDKQKGIRSFYIALTPEIKNWIEDQIDEH